jgi:hypothetical protein
MRDNLWNSDNARAIAQPDSCGVLGDRQFGTLPKEQEADRIPIYRVDHCSFTDHLPWLVP